MRPLPPVAATQFGVFTSVQALAEGWTSHALRHGVASGRLERLRPGVYTPADFEDPVERLRRAAAGFSITNPMVPVSHASAAALFRIQLLTAPDRVCATFPRGHRGAMPGIHRHRGRLPTTDTGHLGCVRLSNPARCVLDVGHEHGEDAAVVAADSALRLGLTTSAALMTAAASTVDWPRITPIHRAIALADADAESALESVSRLRIAAGGLPRPRLQVPIFDHRGIFLGRPDFYWDEFGVIGEADGMIKYADVPGALVAEKRRQSRLERAGLIVVRWGWPDLYSFGVVVNELRDAFARGLRPDRAARHWQTGTWPHCSAVS